MQLKPIKTYSRKRKRPLSPTPDLASSQENRANTSTVAADPDEVKSPVPAELEAKSQANAQAEATLPSPPPSSSPPPLHAIPTNTAACNHASTNTHTLPRRAAAAPKPKKQKLTQLTLDLASYGSTASVQKRCSVCGMEYVPSNAEDAKLHREFHLSSVGGVNVPASVVERWKVVRRCGRKGYGLGAGKGDATALATAKKIGGKRREAGEGTDVIVEVGRRDARCVRNLARRVLSVAESEMGAVSVGEELWDASAAACADATENKHDLGARTKHDQQHDRHKVYLYVQDTKCVGLCLAERISSAFTVHPSSASSTLRAPSSSISTSEKAIPALLGISRIWVSREFRGHGIARELLDAARREFLYGVEIYKASVAFSQPTESGSRLARAWFGMDDGWMVYDLSRCSEQ